MRWPRPLTELDLPISRIRLIRQVYRPMAASLYASSLSQDKLNFGQRREGYADFRAKTPQYPLFTLWFVGIELRLLSYTDIPTSSTNHQTNQTPDSVLS